MTTEEELLVAAEALAESVLVVGVGPTGEAAAASAAADEAVPATEAAADPDAVVLAVDATDTEVRADVAEAEAAGLDTEAPVVVAVVELAPRAESGERDLLEALSASVDAVVVTTPPVADAGPTGEALAAAVSTFVSIVRDPGFVNLDLADARTVLRPVEFAALGVGTSDDGRPADAVDAAFASLPSGVETDPASGVLVDMLGGPSMSVEDVSDAVTAVRGRVGPDAHVIWGGAVEPSLGGRLEVRLVVAGVSNARTAVGDDCPRCGGALSRYSLAGRSTLSCDACGYAGVSVRLRE